MLWVWLGLLSWCWWWWWWWWWWLCLCLPRRSRWSLLPKLGRNVLPEILGQLWQFCGSLKFRRHRICLRAVSNVALGNELLSYDALPVVETFSKETAQLQRDCGPWTPKKSPPKKTRRLHREISKTPHSRHLSVGDLILPLWPRCQVQNDGQALFPSWHSTGLCTFTYINVLQLKVMMIQSRELIFDFEKNLLCILCFCTLPFASLGFPRSTWQVSERPLFVFTDFRVQLQTSWASSSILLIILILIIQNHPWSFIHIVVTVTMVRTACHECYEARSPREKTYADTLNYVGMGLQFATSYINWLGWTEQRFHITYVHKHCHLPLKLFNPLVLWCL